MVTTHELRYRDPENTAESWHEFVGWCVSVQEQNTADRHTQTGSRVTPTSPVTAAP